MKTNNRLKQLLCVVFNLLVALPLVASTFGKMPNSSADYDAIIETHSAAIKYINNSTASSSEVSNVILQQIGDEANTAAPSVVTVGEINTITPVVTGAILANEAAYQAYIDANELPPLEFQASRPLAHRQRKQKYKK